MNDQARSRLLSRILQWTIALTVPVMAAGWLMWDVATALGILCGSALGALNFILLGRSMQKMFANPDEHRGSKWTLPVTMLVKWPLILGGLAIVMLYFPVSPQGVAIGALVSLVGGATAALREHRAQR
ncbi:MAG: ATP synthase subunit I [Nannocystaceae bacterium]|nr:ATP synthase subunit I [Nannocystaceae bacterium]